MSLIPYEDIARLDRGNPAFVADEVLSRGWVLGTYAPVPLDAPLPWKLASQTQRSLNFHLHSWDPVESLLQAHSVTGLPRYLEAAVELARDWVDTHHAPSTDDEPSPFAWYDMAVGLRSYRLAYILDAAARGGRLAGPAHAVLSAALEQHARFLADDANIAFHNNHGYYQVAGQLAMGRRFALTWPAMAEAAAQARERLRGMLAQQFGADGVHREHSPDYHRMVYETLRAMMACGLLDDEELRAKALAIERALSWFVLPSGHIANFGDSDYRQLRRRPDEAARKWATPQMRHVVTQGLAGEPPDSDHAAFPDGGYFVVRRPAGPDAAGHARAGYLAQIAGFHSRTHKHADDLSFLWSDRGSDLLVDAGRYGYIGKVEQETPLWHDGHWYSDPRRVYCESTRAHNTLEFDDRNLPRKGVKPYGSALRRWRSDAASGVIAVETECRHFRTIRRARVLAFLPGRWLLVFDWFEDNAREPHTVRQWFHLAPHLSLAEDGTGWRVDVEGSAEPLRAVSLLPGATRSPAILAQTEPQMQGWWSAKERDIVPAYAFCHALENAVTGSIATLFSFSNELVADPASRVNASGRGAMLRWRDAQGPHALRLDRPESGELSLSYAPP